ncbi:hypothetical protein SRABI112_01240 [Pseudomonas mediterranea]|uniref:Lipoprotein n=1 Tax=Pseudomonas mediterranea TaxID=183795 RepID=A0AAX2D5A3_9PSED|nr:hypothetical protein SRABI112_01240 [Pseudomonas mediterranea]SDU06357.1 hypothetical protein SAMN05216476_0264 [Pseudomonas mediterranea]
MSLKLTILSAMTASLLLAGCMKIPEIPPLLAHCKAPSMTPAITSLPG